MKIIKNIIVSVLTFEARMIIKKYKPYIIAVTGSVGKTSTKDAIYEITKLKFPFVRKSQKSMNSEIGLPLTIIGVSNAWYDPRGWIKNIWKGLVLIFWPHEYPDCLILEIGADHPGDIEKISKWLKTDISVITKIGELPVHVEAFKNAEEIKKEKLFLVKSLKKEGTLIIYGDDKILKDVSGDKGQKIIKYGTNEECDVIGLDTRIKYENNYHGLSFPVGIMFNAKIGQNIGDIYIRDVVGFHQIYSVLASLAVGYVFHILLNDMKEVIGKYNPPKGRMHLIPGKNDSIIIDDTYNSSPVAQEEAIKTLNEVKCSGKKIAILGDMMELGKYGAEAHRKVGHLVSSVANLIITIGPRSRLIAEEVLRDGKLPESVLSFDSYKEALNVVSDRVGRGDCILIKGSQAIRLEHITKILMDEPARARQFLVRQEEEWIKKV